MNRSAKRMHPLVQNLHLGYMRFVFLLICVLSATIYVQAQDLKIIFKNSETQAIIEQARINVFCGNKLIQLETNDSGIIFIPKQLARCKIVADAKGFDTKYNLIVEDSINIIYLVKRNTLLQDVVVTGQPKHILAEKSIYKVNVINTATLRQQAANTLADALATQSNFYTQQDNILGSTINMQGIGGQNIKILMNGVPMNGREMAI
jgi:outer membrane receptor for ferrienterochelin and colicins